MLIHPDAPLPTAAPAVDVFLDTFDDNDILRVAAYTGVVASLAQGVQGFDLAVDPAGNLYRAHWATDSGVLKLPAGGGAPELLARGFGTMCVAADWAGNIYTAGFYPNTAVQTLKLPADGGEPAVIYTSQEFAWAIAVDGLSNVYLLQHPPVKVLKVPSGGGQPTMIDFSGVFRGEFVAAFAVDPQGQNLYLSDWNGPSDTILKVPLTGGPRTNLGTGLAGVQGVAVDVDGNVYIADTFNDRVVAVLAQSGEQVTICRAKTPVPLAITPTRLHSWNVPDLVGRLFGGAAVDGGGWLVIGDHFIPIPPRSPVLSIMLRAAAAYLGGTVENPELGRQLRDLR
jgi:hypothetical protein